ncbi:LysR family transcriptional regulator [Ramlibacter sp.]|uniref:LysR family transcriptional regulator n=1 Tax=Ramlibacter sp. TaxID=1917967 RepID=UPI0035B2D93B
MEFRHLRYFLAVAEELHFGRAARRLAISQPPLSLNIRQLEESVGVRLFHRNSKEVRLTPAGRAFVPAARALLQQATDAASHAREVAQGHTGRVRVGLVSSMLYRGLPRLVRDFQARHPGLQVVLRELSSHDQVVELTQGQLDVGFVHTQRVPPELARERFATEPFLCCLPSGHALARSRRLALRRLEGEPFVMFSRTASPDYYERVLAICSEAGFYPDVQHEARHWLSVVSMVAQGVGVSLVPAALKGSALPGAVFLPVTPAEARSEVFCVWRQADDQVGVQAFVTAVRAAAPGPG